MTAGSTKRPGDRQAAPLSGGGPPLVRRFVVTGLALAGLLVSATGAPAHLTPLGVRTIIDSIDPAIPGVTIQIATSIAAELVVANPTATELQVLRDDGRPFLRIGPEGVLGDLDTTDWYFTNSPTGVADIPDAAQVADAPPRWGRVSHDPSWGWFDHRLHPQPITTNADPHRSYVDPIRLSDWKVPLRYGDTAVTVTGHVEYRLLPGSIVSRLEPGPSLPGVNVNVLDGRVPGLFLTNSSSQPVVVVGRAGEPFLRVGQHGVDANAHSPSYVDDLRARGASPAVEADANAPPEWTRVSETHSYAWLETRAAFDSDSVPLAAVQRRMSVQLRSWKVPLTTGGRRVLLRGITSYVPSGTQPPAVRRAHRRFPVVPVVVVGLAAAAVAAATTVRRNRRGSE